MLPRVMRLDVLRTNPEHLNFMRCSDTVMMRNHGSVPLGRNGLDRYKKLDMLEHTAKTHWIASCVGTVKPRDPEHCDSEDCDPEHCDPEHCGPEHTAEQVGTREKLGIRALNPLETSCGRLDGSR